MGMRGRHDPLLAMEETHARNSRAVALRLAGYLSAYWPQLILASVMTLLNAAAFAAGPLLMGRAIDQFISVGDRSGLAHTMLLLLAVYIVSTITMMGQFWVIGTLGQRVLARIRRQIFAKILTLNLSYFDRHDAGDLMSRLTNDVDVLNQMLSNGLVQFISGAFQMIAVVLAMLFLNWQLALISLSVIPVMLVVLNLLARRARTAFRQTRETMGDVNVELEENISGVRVAQAYNREETNRAHFAQINAANRDANVSAVGITAAFNPVVDVLSTIAIAIAMGVGGYMALLGAITVGVVVSFLRYVQMFFRPVQQISQVYALLQSALAAGERIFELLDEEPDLVDKPDAPDMPSIQGRITFDHVDFSYNLPDVADPYRSGAESPDWDGGVLHDISLDIPAGHTAAIVGPTGAGKTTLVNLVGRFYEVSGGRVLVDGTDVRDVTRASLRSQLGIVLQESMLFSGSVADNIRYGRLDASDEEVEAAAKSVGAHNFIVHLAQGYQTLLGERGSSLSQGQRQLIGLARAVLADPRILILDEATANVDTRTELVIQNALEQLLQNRTSLVIAHRLSTVRNADRVFVLESGRVVEQGTHDELMARGGAYADLYARQFRDIATS